MSDTVTHWSIDRLDTLRLIQPPQSIEPKSGQPRVQGRGGVGSAFSEVLARAVARREPVHVGAEVRDQLDRSGVEWTPELQGQLGEVMGQLLSVWGRVKSGIYLQPKLWPLTLLRLEGLK